MKKRLTALALAFVMVLGTVALAAGAEKTISVTPMTLNINGQTVTPSKSNGAPAEVFSYDGATYVPLRYLSELLGITVEWDKNDPNTAKLVSDKLTVPVQADTTFTPGTYTVESMGHNAPIKVAVTFSQNAITNIQVLEHDESKAVGDVAMEEMSKEILARQSLKVDTLSGATVTGAIFRNLITTAVKEAGGDPGKMQTPAPALDPNSLPDETVDLVVVGGGAAGLAATVEAAEQGVNVILVEQLGILGGASARAGGTGGANTKLLAQYGMTFTEEQYYNYLAAPLGPSLDPQLLDEDYCRELSVRAGQNIDWLQDMGVDYGQPLATAYSGHWGEGGGRVAWSIVKQLHQRMDDLGVDYRLNTRATELVTSGNKVTGVKVTAPNGTEYTISGKVLLATGGYLGSKEMVKKYKPEYANNGTDVTIGNDGSGLVMAEAVGANAVCLDSVVIHALAAPYNGASRSLTTPAGHGCIAVNQDGKRYYAENAAYAYFGAATLEQEAAYCIMNEDLFNVPDIKNDHSLSCIKEMYICRDTVEELAEAIGVPADNLKETIERYGEFVRNGKDEDFHKETAGLTSGLDSDFSKGPYYAVKAAPENHTVYGGITTDNTARVLRADGTVIDGLYAAGEVACFKEAGRAPLTTSIDLGRVVARDVAASLKK